MSKKRPKANEKLQNNKAVRDMLQGSHKSQTKTVIGYQSDTNTKKREIGERWTDANGTIWEQRDGYRIKDAERGDLLKEIQDMIRMPSHCPKCNKPLDHRLDKKFWNLEKQCFNCQVEYETKLRIKGTYQEYEKNKMLANVKAWLIDAAREKEVVKHEITKNTFVNSNGILEKWTLPYDPEVMKKQIDENFEKFKKDLLSKYGENYETKTTDKNENII